MSQALSLSSCALCSVLALSTATAATPLSLQHLSLAELPPGFQVSMSSLKSAQTAAIDGLQFVKQHTDLRHITHVRLQQMYRGFPVFGGYAVVHTSKPLQGLAKPNASMNGVVYRDLTPDLGQVPTAFVAEGSAALQQVKAAYTSGVISEEQVVPLVYAERTHRALWAYKVSFRVTYKDKMPERPVVIVDAYTRQPLIQWNDLKTARVPVNGLGFGGNERVGRHQYGEVRALLPISREALTARCFMENKAVKVIDVGHKYNAPSRAMSFDCIDPDQRGSDTYWTGVQASGYDEINGAYSPSNDALYAGQVIKDLYKSWYDLDVLQTVRGQPLKLVMRVHFGHDFANAYWDQKQMTFGDGDALIYPLVSVGISAHEISHGFTEQHADLNYMGQSGGINEAFSDMAAQAAEYFVGGQSSWTIGSEVMKASSGMKALRYMDKPSRDGQSIDSAAQYHEGLDVHYSSGVYNHLFYLLSNQPGWTVKEAFHVMVKANMDYWTPYSTFDEGSCGVLHASEDLGYSVSDVQQALEQVALRCG